MHEWKNFRVEWSRCLSITYIVDQVLRSYKKQSDDGWFIEPTSDSERVEGSKDQQSLMKK